MAKWVIPEKYTAFENEEQAAEFCKVWGLLPQKASKQKLYKYKGQNMDVSCEIIGYADHVYAVIRIGDQLHNIHPSYLREMQAANYGKGKIEEDVELIETEGNIDAEKVAEEKVEEKKVKEKKVKKTSEETEKQAVEKPLKPAPVTLQEGKVSIKARVSEFASVPNPFSDTDDEVIIFEEVSFTNENETTMLESAWSSHSNAMKKLELQIGDMLSFEAKLVVKKLNKHPVKYKINNAAKITKKNPE